MNIQKNRKARAKYAKRKHGLAQGPSGKKVERTGFHSFWGELDGSVLRTAFPQRM
jgi:hypothetical protein